MLRLAHAFAAAVGIALVLTVASTRLLADDPCSGSHGAYTTALCRGESLHFDQYLESANHRFRLYFQGDGGIYVFDITTSPWTACTTITDGSNYSSPSHFFFGDWNVTQSDMNWSYYQYADGGESIVASDYIDGNADGTSFLRMDDSGTLSFYDQAGERYRGGFYSSCS